MRDLLTVDIVIPVLNEAHVLANSVAIVRRFASEHLSCGWRIVVVDNGSVDGTDRVARALAGDFSDVTFLQLVQRGRGRAQSAGFTLHQELSFFAGFIPRMILPSVFR